MGLRLNGESYSSNRKIRTSKERKGEGGKKRMELQAFNLSLAALFMDILEGRISSLGFFVTQTTLPWPCGEFILVGSPKLFHPLNSLSMAGLAFVRGVTTN